MDMLTSTCLLGVWIGVRHDESADRRFCVLRHPRSGKNAEHAQEDYLYLDKAGEVESAQAGTEVLNLRQSPQTIHRLALIYPPHYQFCALPLGHKIPLK